MTEAEAKKRLAQLQGLKIHPRDQEENRLVLARAERLWEEALGETRDVIAQAAQAFGEALRSQEPARILRVRKRCQGLLDRVEAGLSLEGFSFGEDFFDEDEES